jgi:5-methyltetrahydropteroyltriglutamate--homocysteine methyltransferase
MSILTTHVGSLPRTQKVVDFIFARERAEPYDEAGFDAAMTEAVLETVAGNRRWPGRHRLRWRNIEDQLCHLCEGPLHRFRRRQPAQCARRPEAVPQLPAKRLANEGGTPKYARPMCVGEVKSKGQGELEKDIANLKAAMEAHGLERGFMNAASPGVISLFLQNDFYPTREAYLQHSPTR